MTVRELNTQKKMFRCLKCGKYFRTDRCHRTCPKCKKAMFRYRDGIRPVFDVAFSFENAGELDASVSLDDVQMQF